ncbi:MAG TPA: hypothetical protein VGU43_03360, partial [Thermoplasmata archaeon]|nr:hypothetical protein [Thermoplasmata archaeon]
MDRSPDWSRFVRLGVFVVLKRSDVVRSLPLLLLGLLLIPSGALASASPALPAPHAAPLAHPAATHGDLIVD